MFKCKYRCAIKNQFIISFSYIMQSINTGVIIVTNILKTSFFYFNPVIAFLLQDRLLLSFLTCHLNRAEPIFKKYKVRVTSKPVSVKATIFLTLTNNEVRSS